MGTTTAVGERIAAGRKALGLTQQDLADRVGVTSQAVSKWETEASLPDTALLPALAKLLETSIDELLTGEASDRPAGAAAVASWGRITGTVTKDIHGDVGTIVGDVLADIYGNVNGDVVGQVRNVFGNVEGNVIGDVQGDVTGYVKGRLLGVVHGRVKGGVRGRVLGTVIGDGINVEEAPRAKRRR